MAIQEVWNPFLTKIMREHSFHYLWLRSLSYLEYIGYRKMVKALAYEKVSREVFHHLSDEIRHSYMLKELADKILMNKNFLSQEKCNAKECFEVGFVENAEGYFQDLDKEVENWVEKSIGKKDAFLCYLVTSYIIELRAMMVYPSYLKALSDSDGPDSEKAVLQQIIKDEREHLSYIESNTKGLSRLLTTVIPNLKVYEERRFTKFLKDFDHCVQSSKLRLSA